MKYPPRADLDYEAPPDGFPAAACAVCGGSPCAFCVRWWETTHEPLSPNQLLRAGQCETHFFCWEHQAASERVYAEFTRKRLRSVWPRAARADRPATPPSAPR